MKIGTARSYAILVWLLPLLMVVGGRDLLIARGASAWTHLSAYRSQHDRTAEANGRIKDLPAMKQDYERLARKKTEIASSLFGAKSEASLYDLLMLKASESRVSIAAVSPRPRRVAEGFVELPLLLEVTGSYGAIGRFVSAIENGNRLMRIEEAAMTKDRTGRLVAFLTTIAYLYADTLRTAIPRGRKTGGDRKEYQTALKQALGVTINVPDRSYASSGKPDPFGSVAVRRYTVEEEEPDETDLSALSLKGILWKETPLAILETLEGRTHIVRKGESVAGYTISSIARSEVTVTGPGGTHLLRQYDERR